MASEALTIRLLRPRDSAVLFTTTIEVCDRDAPRLVEWLDKYLPKLLQSYDNARGTVQVVVF